MFRISYNAVQCQMLQICVVELMMLMLLFLQQYISTIFVNFLNMLLCVMTVLLSRPF